MSDLTDRIAREHTVDGIGGHGRIEVTEAALREQIAASCNKLAVVEGEHGRSNYAEIWQEAADIARGS